MKCKCGNDIAIRIALKVDSKACKILTSTTTVLTVECSKCKSTFQVPITTNNYIAKE